ncbi:diguanylate cyclase [Paraglaciecola sp. 2405UD69-4]|uniref:tetratricopeptide repeat-containing diguanylate cyclase n=1 Tax=Paraglaciecola sp. 2405UD69-4 TaxID=3391836 RepID=UPI0039C94B09
MLSSFWFSAVGHALSVSTNASQSKPSDLLKKAKSLVGVDNLQSEAIALDLIKLSKTAKPSHLANAHALLADLYRKPLKDIVAAKYHYSQAAKYYLEADNTRQYILTIVSYSKLILSEKNYEFALDTLERSLPIALQADDPLLSVRVFELQGRILYEQRLYTESEHVYFKVIEQLKGLNNNKALELKGAAYHQLGQIYKRLYDDEKAVIFHKKSLDVQLQRGDENGIARAYKNVAGAELRNKHYLAALDYAFKGYDIQKTLNDNQEAAEYLTLIGIAYRYLNRYETSLEYSIQAYQIYLETNNIKKVADSLIQIGFLYTRLYKYEQAKVFYTKAIELPQDKVPAKILASAYRELAIIELEEKNFDLALNMAQKAYDIYQQDNNKLKSTIAMRIIGEIKYAQGMREEAIKYYKDALALVAGGPNDIRDINKVKVLNKLGRALADTNNQEAIEILNEAIEISVEEGFLNEESDAYTSLLRLAKANQDYKQALSYAEEKLRLAWLISQEYEEQNLTIVKAKMDSFSMETELATLRKQVDLDKLKLAQKNSEIEIVGQTNRIAELELVKKRYANILLAFLLLICLCGCIYVYRIFIASKKRNIELDYLATHDQLTNCYNRRGLFDFFESHYQNDEITDELAIIMVDVDHFKKVNDLHGHETGDDVLRSFSKILLDSVRKSDLIARYGGEEFCIVLRGVGLPYAENIASKLRQKIETANFNGIKITSSFGIAYSQSDELTPVQLIARADKALYKSKFDGRNRVTLWHPKLDEVKLTPQ